MAEAVRTTLSELVKREAVADGVTYPSILNQNDPRLNWRVDGAAAALCYVEGMTLEAIKEAIQHLPDEERRQLAGWFEQMEEAAWDADIRHDFAPGGKGERLLKDIQQEFREGKARPLEEGLARRRQVRS